MVVVGSRRAQITYILSSFREKCIEVIVMRQMCRFTNLNALVHLVDPLLTPKQRFLNMWYSRDLQSNNGTFTCFPRMKVYSTWITCQHDTRLHEMKHSMRSVWSVSAFCKCLKSFARPRINYEHVYFRIVNGKVQNTGRHVCRTWRVNYLKSNAFYVSCKAFYIHLSPCSEFQHVLWNKRSWCVSTSIHHW